MKDLNPNSWHFKMYEYLYKNWTYPFAHDYGVPKDVESVDLCTYLRGLTVTPLSVIVINLVAATLPIGWLWFLLSTFSILNMLTGLSVILLATVCAAGIGGVGYILYTGVGVVKDKVVETATVKDLIKGYNKVFCPILKVQK